MAKMREEISIEDKWDLTSLYEDLNAWEKDFNHPLPNLSEYKGKLGDKLAEFLKLYFETERRLTKLFTYAHLVHDQDVANEPHKNAFDRISMRLHQFQEEVSFVEPEIISLKKVPQVPEYQIFIDKIVRQKPHTLSANEEGLIALAGQALDSSSRTFSLFNNADLKFPKAKGKDLTLGTYGLYMQGSDRPLRQAAFENLHGQYAKYENTICEMINGQVQAHLFQARSHKHKNCVSAALFPFQVDPKVYYSLIEAVRKKIAALHRYISLRKKVLKLDAVHGYDMLAPMVKEEDRKFSKQEAIDLVIESVAPLGSDYQNILKRGLEKEGWADWYENERKRSGAYSSGCYDSHPYMLLNFQGTLRDVMTLAHEAGHSMHSYHSNKNQPFQYSHYPIFVAEVASTYNEELLFRHLMQDEKLKLSLINQKLDDIRSTLFRQTQFAEFELKLHTLAEEGVPLGAPMLKEAYKQLNIDYYGKDFFPDDAISVEFLRVPHFYYNFYVYQYATGIAASYALVERDDRSSYLEFLSGGSSKFPLELLKNAGVDMESTRPIEQLIRRFNTLIEEFDGAYDKS